MGCTFGVAPICRGARLPEFALEGLSGRYCNTHIVHIWTAYVKFRLHWWRWPSGLGIRLWAGQVGFDSRTSPHILPISHPFGNGIVSGWLSDGLRVVVSKY